MPFSNCIWWMYLAAYQEILKNKRDATLFLQKQDLRSNYIESDIEETLT